MKTLILLFFLFWMLPRSKAQQIVTLPESITGNTTLVASNQYRIETPVTVKPGAVLTIMPGTVIKVDDPGSLTISKGAKIYALGAPDAPIVFTLNEGQSGWGGIYIKGNAPVDNSPGDPLDNSGVFKYVRLEFIWSFQLYGVGSGTELHHVQVSYGTGESFSFVGGTVNAYYLVANESVYFYIITRGGHKGVIQFALGTRFKTPTYPFLYSGFFHDDYSVDQTFISNVTFNGGTDSTWVCEIRPVYLSNYSKSAVFNSLFINFFYGLFLDGDTAVQNFMDDKIKIKSNVFADIDSSLLLHTVFNLGWVPMDDSMMYAYGNRRYPKIENLKLKDPIAPVPDFRPKNNSPILQGANTSDPLYKYWEKYLTKTTYRGAFDSKNDWTKPWTEWDPKTYNYCPGCPTIRRGNMHHPKYQEKNSTELRPEIQERDEFSIYPSPAKNYITLRLSSEIPDNEKIYIQIFDFTGSLKKKLVNENKSGYHEITVDISDLAPDLYTVSVHSATKQFNKTIVIQ